ncbi:lipopolysaccharide biosynthesis protein [Arthrobacter sp. RIT-PI-e]|uniref:lipopolysaccharide biosynthesis protein n=1 Tax=Arthrobacter sp. RIT-PI-e TaxID=1681197 RepID=UPI001364A60A|nr:lipopolysaccharide biosynthesis protein [Arthrobacter sp. RIT-PI-e]
MSLASSAARGAGATFTGQALRFLIQLVSVSILARLLAPDDFGMYAMVIAIIGVATVLGDFGLSMAAIQSQTLTNAQRSNLFWTNVGLGSLLGAGVYFLAGPIASFYNRPELIAVTQVASISFVLNAFAAQFRAEASSKFRFKWLAAADVTAQAVALSVAVVIALNGFGYWALVAQQVVIASITFLVLVPAAGWLPGLPRRNTNMRSLYGFGANTLGVQIFTYVTSNADSVLLGRIAGSSALGIYDRAYQLFRLPLLQIGAPMTRVALPVLSRLQDDPRFDQYAQRAQLILAYTFGGLFFALACVANPLIDIMLGDQWDEAKGIFIVLAVGGVVQALGFVYYWIFLAKAYTGLQLRYSLIGRTLMLLMMTVGVIWGPIGVAIGSSAGQITLFILNSVYAIPKTGVDGAALIRITFRPALLYSVMTLITVPISFLLLNHMDPFLHIGILALFIAFFLSGAVLLSRKIREDCLLILDAAKRVRSR